MKERITISTLALAFLLSLAPAALSAQTPVELKGLEASIEKYMEDWHVVGLAVAVVKDSQVVYARGFGYRDLDGKLPADENTLFAIGSTSKAFTAAGACLLAADGKLSLDDPVKELLPDFQLYDDYATREMTVRDLLCHRSGLPRHDFVWYGSEKSRKELYESLVHLEPTVSFRGRWQYQNLMFMTAGYLIEQVGGQGWEAFTKARLFDPLDMKTANFSVADMQRNQNHSLPYAYDWSKEKLNKMDFRNIDQIGPAGSINAGAREMANWVIMQLNKGRFNGRSVLDSNLLKETHTPHMVIPGGYSKEVFYNTYGLGWFITSYRGHPRVSHGGNIDGFSAEVALYPEDRLGVVVLVNQNGSLVNGIIRNDIADRLLGLETIDWHQRISGDFKKNLAAAAKAREQEDLVRKKDTHPSHSLADYAGKYEHPGYGETRVMLRNDSLFLQHVLGDLHLAHYHYDVFSMDVFGNPMQVQFNDNARGEIETLLLPVEPALNHPIEFKRKAEEKEISEETLAVYVGEYETAGVTLKIYLKEGKLRMLAPGQPEYVLKAVREHYFQLGEVDGYSVEFKMDGKQAKSLVSHQPNGSFELPRKK